MQTRLKEYGISLSGAQKWVAAAVGIDRPEEEQGRRTGYPQEQDLIPISVMQILEEKLGNYCRFSIFNSTGSSDAQIGVIAAIDEENSQTGLTAVLGRYLQRDQKRSWQFLLPLALDTVPRIWA